MTNEPQVPDENGKYPAKPWEYPTYDPNDMPPYPPCDECGFIHARKATSGRWHETCDKHVVRYKDMDPYNQAESNRVTLPCKKFPVLGALVCATHGGSTAKAKAKAAERLSKAKLVERLRLELEEVDPVYLEQHPIQGLLEEVGRSAQAVTWLARQVATLHVADPTEGELANLVGFDEHGEPVVVPEQFRLLGRNHNDELTPHPYWKLLNEERERHARLCKLALDAGINERLINIAQAQAMQMATMMVRALERIGLTKAQINMAKTALAEEMRAMTAGGPVAIPARSRPI